MDIKSKVRIYALFEKCTDVSHIGALIFKIPFQKQAIGYHKYQTGTGYHARFGHKTHGLGTSQ
jgi:hypothetical protein